MEEDSVTEDDSQAPVPDHDSESSNPQPPKKKSKMQSKPATKGKAVMKETVAQKVSTNKTSNKIKKGRRESSDVEIVEDAKLLKKKPATKKIVVKGIFPAKRLDAAESHQKDKMRTETVRYVSLPFQELKLI